MGFACCFGIMGIAKTFVPLFFGAGYDQVVGLLYTFSSIIVIIGVSNCLGSQYYTPCGKRRESTNYLIFGSVVNLILNLLLIPNFGAEGAAVASVIAEAMVSVLYVHFSCGYGDFALLVKTGGKKLLVGFVMFVVIFAMNNLSLNSLVLISLQVVTGALIYVLGLILLRDDWTMDMAQNMERRIKRG